VEIGIPIGMERYLFFYEPDPGLLKTSVFSIGFANGHCKYTSAMSSALATIGIDPRKLHFLIAL